MLGSKGNGEVIPHLRLGLGAIAPKAKVQDGPCLDGFQLGDIANWRTTTHRLRPLHFVSISLPARVMRSVYS